MVGRVRTIFYLPLLKLACILLKIVQFIVQSRLHEEGTLSFNLFLQKVNLALLLVLIFPADVPLFQT